MIKKIGFLLCLCFFMTSGYAASYPVDTVALEEALKEITRVGDSTDSEKIEDAQADLYMYFMENSNKQLSVEDIINQCVKVVQHNRSCMKFLQTYSHYLDHANFCLKANNFELPNLNFKQCGAYVNAAQGFSEEDTKTNEWGNCKRWYDVAEKCLIYLQNYYTQKLSNSKSDKKYYECLLNKIQTGNVDFPISKMEAECK